MALKQTRRSVSLNHDLWQILHEAATTKKQSASEYVAKAIRSQLKRDGYSDRLPNQNFDGPYPAGRTNNRGGEVS